MVEKLPEPKPLAPETGEGTARAPEVATTSAAARTPNTTSRQNYNSGEHRTPDSSYGNYLFAGAGTSDSPAWSDSRSGRAAIRLISRGIVGATFFAIGGRMASNQLRGYNSTQAWDRSKPLQAIAKGIDLTLGKGIAKTVETFAGFKYGFGSQTARDVGQRAVTFRESRHFHDAVRGKGRSYGADIVGFTFDFAMASIGDAGTRSIIQGLDPNIKKAWLVNDAGDPAKRGERKHFLPGEWLKAVGKASWRVMTKNQGEDWAAAIPYAFQMKFQRQFLSNIFNKRWNGHQLVFDYSWNGGAYRIDPKKISSTNPHGIVGDYQMVGAIDLHARFVGYNWYTLMFREGYDAIGRAWSRWKDNGFKLSIPLPEHFNPITTPIDGVLHAARYVTKSFIKANMYMNPAVIPFWLMRVPQSKWRGKNFVEGETPAIQGETNIWKEGGFKPYAASNFDHYKTDTRFDRTEKWISKNIFNPLGKFSFDAGTTAADMAKKHIHDRGWTPKWSWAQNVLKGDQSDIVNGGKRFTHEVVDASLSYTPYMYAKQEFGLLVDDTKGDGKLGQMDLAIYKFMDDVASFKFTQLPADLKKLWKLGTNFEREIKVREGGAPDAQQIAKEQVEPTSKVHASTVRHEPVNLDRADAHAANEGRYHATQSANDGYYHGDQADDSQWVKRVAGSDVSPAQMHRASPTIH